MPLTFNPLTGLEAPDTIEIRNDVVQDWVNAFHEDGQPEIDTDSTTPAGQLINAEVAEIEAKNSDTLWLANQFNPRTAEGRFQDALGYIYFITRKKNEPSVATCQLTGLSGTVIPYGALARTADGQHTLLCNRPVTIVDGVAETTFRTTNTGPIDIPAESVTTIVTVIPGWDTINNATAGVVGRDLETRSDFEARRYESVAKNAHGTVESIYGSLYDIAGTGGVLDVAVLENIGPDPVVKYGVTVPGHGITICIYGGEDEDIARVIYEKKDAGCDTGGNHDVSYTAIIPTNNDIPVTVTYDYKILRPETVGIYIRIVLGDSSTVTSEIIEAIKLAVYQDFIGENTHTQAPRVGLAQEVYASRFYHAITAVEGVNSLLSVEMRKGQSGAYTDYLVINGDEEPTISMDQIEVILQGI